MKLIYVVSWLTFLCTSKLLVTNYFVHLQMKGKAILKMTPQTSTIHNCSDEKLRTLLKNVITKQLVQI